MEPMENIKLVLTRNIKSRRKVLKINQEELAERSGLSTAYIKNIERGVSWPSPESFEALSRGLSLSIGDLLGEGATTSGKQPLSLAIKRILIIPDEIYDLVEGFGPEDKDLWEGMKGVIGAYKIIKEQRETEARKGSG